MKEHSLVETKTRHHYAPSTTEWMDPAPPPRTGAGSSLVLTGSRRTLPAIEVIFIQSYYNHIYHIYSLEQ
jgi:hypothetical protein